MPLPKYGTAKIPPLRPQQKIPQPSPYGRPTFPDNYLRTHHSPQRRTRSTRQETYAFRMSPVRAPESPITSRPAMSPHRGSQPSSLKVKRNHFVTKQSTFDRMPVANFTNPALTLKTPFMSLSKSITYPLPKKIHWCQHRARTLSARSKPNK